jgi:hypothetical protein
MPSNLDFSGFLLRSFSALIRGRGPRDAEDEWVAYWHSRLNIREQAFPTFLVSDLSLHLLNYPYGPEPDGYPLVNGG